MDVREFRITLCSPSRVRSVPWHLVESITEKVVRGDSDSYIFEIRGGG